MYFKSSYALCYIALVINIMSISMFLVYIALCTLGRLFVDLSDEASIKLDSCRPGKCSLAEIVATHTDRTADDHTDNDLVKLINLQTTPH